MFTVLEPRGGRIVTSTHIDEDLTTAQDGPTTDSNRSSVKSAYLRYLLEEDWLVPPPATSTAMVDAPIASELETSAPMTNRMQSASQRLDSDGSFIASEKLLTLCKLDEINNTSPANAIEIEANFDLRPLLSIENFLYSNEAGTSKIDHFSQAQTYWQFPEQDLEITAAQAASLRSTLCNLEVWPSNLRGKTGLMSTICRRKLAWQEALHGLMADLLEGRTSHFCLLPSIDSTGGPQSDEALPSLPLSSTSSAHNRRISSSSYFFSQATSSSSSSLDESVGVVAVGVMGSFITRLQELGAEPWVIQDSESEATERLRTQHILSSHASLQHTAAGKTIVLRGSIDVQVFVDAISESVFASSQSKMILHIPFIVSPRFFLHATQHNLQPEQVQCQARLGTNTAFIAPHKSPLFSSKTLDHLDSLCFGYSTLLSEVVDTAAESHSPANGHHRLVLGGVVQLGSLQSLIDSLLSLAGPNCSDTEGRPLVVDESDTIPSRFLRKRKSTSTTPSPSQSTYTGTASDAVPGIGIPAGLKVPMAFATTKRSSTDSRVGNRVRSGAIETDVDDEFISNSDWLKAQRSRPVKYFCVIVHSSSSFSKFSYASSVLTGIDQLEVVLSCAVDESIFPSQPLPATQTISEIRWRQTYDSNTCLVAHSVLPAAVVVHERQSAAARDKAARELMKIDDNDHDDNEPSNHVMT